MQTLEYIDLAIQLYDAPRNMPTDAKKLIGGPFSLDQIVTITRVPPRYLRRAYKDNVRPGGRLNPDSLKDIGQLRYLLDIGGKLDVGLVWKVVLAGTQERVLARLLGVRPKQINDILKEAVADETHYQVRRRPRLQPHGTGDLEGSGQVRLP